MNNIKYGLRSAEINSKLIEFGYNELSTSRPKTILRIALEVIKEPMFLLLISCGLLYIILGDYKEGIILISTIFIIISITFFQHRKTEKALEALKKLSSPRALVIRDGIEIRIPGREVVPGDIVIINEGDRVPADGEIIESLNLQIDESIITGESLPVDKSILIGNKQLLSGTLVTKGRGVMLVEQTGQQTQFGKIGESLEAISEEQTPLQQEMKKLIRRLGIIGILISIVVVALFYFTRGNLIQSILNGLAAAMAILPEEFPVILTVFLALGAWRLSKKNVLTRKPSAIETLGSATVLCSDKTGTITQNKMIVSCIYDGVKTIKKQDFKHNQKDISEIITISNLACSPKSIDPMEKAIEIANKEINQNQSNLEFVYEYAFSHEFLAMTRVYKDQISGELILATKGAPETILSLCSLDSQTELKYAEEVIQIAKKGLRVLAIATAKTKLSNNKLPKDQSALNFQICGLIGLEDPIRPEVPAAIEECKKAGIRVILITGDYPETAKNIGEQIGLSNSGLLTGDQLDQLSDEELKSKIETISILARVKPQQKLRIVQALKSNNEIVAMTGDGVNDAPALKAAHIGVAMGNKGTDVAREASSLVLLDDNFASIVSAIRMGRKIFDNLQKAMSYVLAIHIPIIGLALFPAFYESFPLLLMPLHIVFMELIIDPVSSVAFESEEEEKGIMDRPPRNPSESFFGSKRIFTSMLQGLLLLVMVLIVFFISKKEGHSEDETRAITYSALITGNIFLTLTKISTTRSFLNTLLSKNWQSKIILVVALFFLSLILFIPGISKLFNMSFPGFYHISVSVLGAIIMLIILEIIKFIQLKKQL
jgi:Ca2+-transporting ATPase